MRKQIILAGLLLMASQSFGETYTAEIDGKTYHLKPTFDSWKPLENQNGFDPVKTGFTGVGMFTFSLLIADKNLDWGHATELQAWSFCWTYMGFRFFPPDMKWLSPVFVTAFDFSYRSSQWKKDDPTGFNDVTLRKFFCDFSGVLGAMVMELDLDKKKDIHLDVAATKAQLTIKFN